MNTEKIPETVGTQALENMLALSRNRYPGRGIVIGKSQDSRFAVQIYWIMGRSENSRNRIFKSEGGRLFTEAFDPSKVKDPSLIIYNAMREDHNEYVVSNGDQTDTVIDAFGLSAGITLREALSKRQYEPDAPNFTPRITGLCVISPTSENFYTELSLLRKSDLIAGSGCERSYYEYEDIKPGFGFCITTYNEDGDPLPSFVGEPYPLPIIGNVEEIVETFWSVLNVANRVSLAVKFIYIATGESHIKIVNRLSKVGPTTA